MRLIKRLPAWSLPWLTVLTMVVLVIAVASGNTIVVAVLLVLAGSVGVALAARAFEDSGLAERDWTLRGIWNQRRR
jgi:hypothetical protein